MSVGKDVITYLAENDWLNENAKRWGTKIGARAITAGTTMTELTPVVQKLNYAGLRTTIVYLGDGLYEKAGALDVKKQYLELIHLIQEKALDATVTLQLTQLGLDIAFDFCYENVKEIVSEAYNYGVQVTIEMEDYGHVQPSFRMLEQLKEEYDNLGTVIQAYFYRAEEDIKKYKDVPIRLVKGAYDEPISVAYQTKEEIDANYKKLLFEQLQNGIFTSIATHDREIIAEVKQFVQQQEIPLDAFEFQLLYGFDQELQEQLIGEGYACSIYVPYGEEWYSYFMNRLAERPQNITKKVFNKKTNTVLAAVAGAFVLGSLWGRRKKK